MTALKAESLAAANDARRNTRQFAMDPSQFKSDMQASVESTAAVRDLTGEIGSNVEHMAEGSAGFNQEWEWLAAHTFTVNEGLQKAIEYMQELQWLQSDLANQAAMWGLALERAFKGVLTGELHNTRDLLRSIVTDMRDFYAELAAREAAMAVLKGVKKVITSIFGAATGAPCPTGRQAFSGGRVVPFATGGVVSSPTAFPMAGGDYRRDGRGGPRSGDAAAPRRGWTVGRECAAPRGQPQQHHRGADESERQRHQ